MKRPKKQDGCLPHLLPAYVMDAGTGEELDYKYVLGLYVTPFLEYVRGKVEETISDDKDSIMEAISGEEKISQPTGIAWKHGIVPDLADAKKMQLLATSRIERVVQHRIVSEVKSYLNNPDPNKQEPTYDALKANLGAADKQMASASYDEDLHRVLLTWKCWTRELTLVFDLPDFASGYDISKVSLPSVYLSTDRGRIEFDIPFTEALDYSENEFNHCYGAADLGRKEPFKLSFKNHKGAVIAEFGASGLCRALNGKRNRILANKKAVIAKLDQYDALGIPEDDPKRKKLEEEKRNLGNKAKREGEALARLIGWEISRCCQRVGAAALAVEDLKWVSEEHGTSRWNYAMQQEWIARECQRVGTAFLTVSAKDSSQTCSDCGSKDITHDNEKRTIKCNKCKLEMDRDASAARVLADRCARAYRRYIGKVALSRIKMRC